MYRSGKATPLQVVDALLPLIKQGQHPPGKYEDAWAPADGYVQLAIESAKESTDRWAAGNPIGILDGVPIGVKDELSVKGLRNFFGMKYNASMACFKKQDESAWPVKKLQDAGAIILGKNRMHQLGAGKNARHPAAPCTESTMLTSANRGRYQRLQRMKRHPPPHANHPP